MKDPRLHKEPKVKVATREQVLPVNVILVPALLLVVLLIVRAFSGT